MFNALSAFSNDDNGATAIEYGIIAALVALVIAVSLPAMGLALEGAFDRAANGIA